MLSRAKFQFLLLFLTFFTVFVTKLNGITTSIYLKREKLKNIDLNRAVQDISYALIMLEIKCLGSI